jgi:hypothetical protein
LAALLSLFEDSVAFDVDQLPQLVPHRDQVCGVMHDLVDRLVGGRDFVNEGLRGAELDSPHGAFQFLQGERFPGGVPGVFTPRAVR